MSRECRENVCERPAVASTAAAARPDVADAPAVSIIVVSFNTRELTLEAVRSAIDQTTSARFEIIVVDNASSDGSADAIAAAFPETQYPFLRLVRSADNLGFGAANNLASSLAKGRRLLLLNPDTVVLDAAIDRLQDFADANPQAGIWGGRTLFADGRLNPGSCWQRITVWNQFSRASGLAAMFPRSDLFNPETMGGWPRDTVREVDIVSGCFLLIDTDLWRRLGGLAPTFFMYGEEADLCLRAHALGARPLVTPDAVIIHYGGASETVRADKMVRLLAAKSELIERHMAGAERVAARALLHAWPVTRRIATALRALVDRQPGSRLTADTWTRILARKSEWRFGVRPATAPARIAQPAGPGLLSDARTAAPRPRGAPYR